MRIWHKDLISVLPDKQLRGQWRECCLIAKALHDGNLNHLLVNKVKEYPTEHFYLYCAVVEYEMIRRGFKTNWDKISKYIKQERSASHSELLEGWHNDRYLRQCLYNLQEKFDCGGISDDEWTKIVEKFPWIDGGNTHE